MTTVRSELADSLYNPLNEVVKTAAEVYLLERVGTIQEAGRSTAGFTIVDTYDTSFVEAGDILTVPITVSGANGLFTYYEFAEVESVPGSNEITLTSSSFLCDIPICGAPVQKVVEGIRTEGGVTVNVSPELGELLSDQSGLTPIDQTLDGIDATVTLPRTSIVVQSYATAFPMFDQVNGSIVLGDEGLGASVNPANNAGRRQQDILVLALNAAAERAIRQVMLYNVGLAEGSELDLNFSKEDQLIQEVQFQSFGEDGRTKRLGPSLLLPRGSRVSIHTQPPVVAGSCTDTGGAVSIEGCN